MLSDDEDEDESKKAQAKLDLLRSGNVQKLLMQIPPDHKQAEIHGVPYLLFKTTVESDFGI
jgi:hypothetical protein